MQICFFQNLYLNIRPTRKKAAKENQTLLINALTKLSDNPIHESKLTATDMMDKILVAQKKENLEPIPKSKDVSEKSISNWYEQMDHILGCVPWIIDGKSILQMEVITHVLDMSKQYQIRVSHLALLLTQLMHDTGHTKLLDGFKGKHKLGHGVVLINAIRNRLMSLHATAVCEVLEQLAECLQGYQETAHDYGHRLDDIFAQLNRLGYNSFKSLKTAFYQRGVLHGAYRDHKSLTFFKGQLHDPESSCTLKDFDTSSNFIGYMASLYKSIGSTIGSGRPAYSLQESGIVLRTTPPTEDEVDLLFSKTRCPICLLAHKHPCSHHLSKCEHCEQLGLSIEYDPDNDKQRSDHKRQQNRLQKNQESDKQDDAEAKRKEEARCKAREANTKHKKECADVADAVALETILEDDRNIVGADGKPVTTTEEKINAISNNIRKQEEAAKEERAKTKASKAKAENISFDFSGDGRCSVHRLSQFSATTDANKDLRYIEASVEETDNDIKNGNNVYMDFLLQHTLGSFNCTDTDGTVRCCLSIACYIPHGRSGLSKRNKHGRSDLSKRNKQMVANSGATSHMRTNIDDFVSTMYKHCKDVFVLVGDGREITVLGYGPSCIKINGHVIVLDDSLHVPDLDCVLFSATRHGLNGKVCYFLLSEGMLYLTYPIFTFKQPIPSDGDLRIELEDLTKHNWGLPDFICDGHETSNDTYLDDFQDCIKFLNHVF